MFAEVLVIDAIKFAQGILVTCIHMCSAPAGFDAARKRTRQGAFAANSDLNPSRRLCVVGTDLAPGALVVEKTFESRFPGLLVILRG